MLTKKSGCQNVVIVGGGPSGLAIALMLAKRGWTEITVLEKEKRLTITNLNCRNHRQQRRICKFNQCQKP